jgi:alkylation response protein AidB-like acyl-CoA dehydrogenase
MTTAQVQAFDAALVKLKTTTENVAKTAADVEAAQAALDAAKSAHDAAGADLQTDYNAVNAAAKDLGLTLPT